MNNKTLYTFTMAGGSNAEFANKIKTIKGYRTLSDATLIDAKSFVENVQQLGEITTAFTLHCQSPRSEQEAIREMRDGGITVTVAGETIRDSIREEITAIAFRALSEGQLDTAKKLIEVIETV